MYIIQAKRVSNCYIPKNIYVRVSCVRLILVLVGSVKRYCYIYVCTTYVPVISRQKYIRTYVMFRPWTHTSDDSFIYQLSLVVATATLYLINIYLVLRSTRMICRLSCACRISNIFLLRWHGTLHCLLSLLHSDVVAGSIPVSV